ncbi:MAG: nucleotide exchange factor GrpE [Puniceicoccales bacterium]|jgi:molecular chaperone GrpE|nr:nucleotide exchange factor GrpE [Puniceicoccales bacterium]
MDTIDEKTQRERNPENANPEIEDLDSQSIENNQDMANLSDNKENLIQELEKIANLQAEIPVNISVTDFVAQELRQLREQLLRAQADFDNYRKRAIRDQDDLRRFACADFIEELLPVLDSFELGLKSMRENSHALSGFQMIFMQLQSLLATRGLKEIAPQGEAFNPQWEEAVAYVHDESIPQEHVVQTVRKGYLLHDRLLRPAAVVVSKGAQMEGK